LIVLTLDDHVIKVFPDDQQHDQQCTEVSMRDRGSAV